jgi:hypothetical protein
MPWYKNLGEKLNSIEGLVDLILVGCIIFSIIGLASKDNVFKTAIAVYLVSP